MTRRRDAQVIGVPLDVIETPRDGEVYADRYWVHCPDLGVLFWRGPVNRAWSPQCNRDERLPHRLAVKMYSEYKDCEVVHVPVAYLGHWDDEWGFLLSWFRDEIAEQLAAVGASA